MKDFFEGILMLGGVILSFILPFFVFGYIIKSLIKKELSIKNAKRLVLSIVLAIFLNIIPILIVRAEISAIGGDENGDYIFAVIYLLCIILALINLFILGLFYTLYYVKLNKNNSEVDNKKPIKIFMIICLLLIPIIVFLF